MILVNTPILLDAAKKYTNYSDVLVSFYTLIKAIKLDNAFQLTAFFPEAVEQEKSGSWLLPLVAGKLYVTARIDFRHQLISIKSVSTTRFTGKNKQ
ncbi:hypothetical protein ACFH4J_003419 [Escherichia coli]